MNSVEKRLEKLEEVLNSENSRPSVILFTSYDGRKNAPIDDSPIIRLTSSEGVIYDRIPEDTENEFIRSVSELAKANLQHPLAIPTLFAYTEEMLSEKVV